MKMQKLFRKGAQSLFNNGKFDKDTMHNYFMSGMRKDKAASSATFVNSYFLLSHRKGSDQWDLEREKY